MKNTNIRICDKCGTKALVIDSRSDGTTRIYRRRRCPNCGRWWETIETVYQREYKA